MAKSSVRDSKAPALTRAESPRARGRYRQLTRTLVATGGPTKRQFDVDIAPNCYREGRYACAVAPSVAISPVAHVREPRCARACIGALGCGARRLDRDHSCT